MQGGVWRGELEEGKVLVTLREVKVKGRGIKPRGRGVKEIQTDSVY